MKDRSVVITGGYGFLGSNLARRLVSEGAKVTLVDSPMRNRTNVYELNGRVDKIEMEINQDSEFDEIVKSISFDQQEEWENHKGSPNTF